MGDQVISGAQEKASATVQMQRKLDNQQKDPASTSSGRAPSANTGGIRLGDLLLTPMPVTPIELRVLKGAIKLADSPYVQGVADTMTGMFKSPEAFGKGLVAIGSIGVAATLAPEAGALAALGLGAYGIYNSATGIADGKAALESAKTPEEIHAAKRAIARGYTAYTLGALGAKAGVVEAANAGLTTPVVPGGMQPAYATVGGGAQAGTSAAAITGGPGAGSAMMLGAVAVAERGREVKPAKVESAREIRNNSVRAETEKLVEGFTDSQAARLRGAVNKALESGKPLDKALEIAASELREAQLGGLAKRLEQWSTELKEKNPKLFAETEARVAKSEAVATKPTNTQRAQPHHKNPANVPSRDRGQSIGNLGENHPKLTEVRNNNAARTVPAERPRYAPSSPVGGMPILSRSDELFIERIIDRVNKRPGKANEMKTFARAVDDEIASLGSKHQNLKPYLERIKERGQHKIDSNEFLKAKDAQPIAQAAAPRVAPKVEAKTATEPAKPAATKQESVKPVSNQVAKPAVTRGEKSIHFSSKAGEMDVTISRNKDGSAMLTKEGLPLVRVAGVEMGGNMTLKTFAERFGDKLTQGWENALSKKLGINFSHGPAK